MLSRFSRSDTSLSFLLATAVVLLLFFDVVFLKASIQPGNIYSVLGKPAAHQTVTFPPHINYQQKTEKGTMDLAAPAIQHEPAIGFMARVFESGESPYWNPYSAAGMEGPETLVDMKFSPLVVVSAALFNGSSASYNFLLLGLFVLSGFCLIKALRCYFTVSWTGATLGFLFFLLNGFALANLGSQMGRPYFYAPIMVLTLLYFVVKPTYYRWILLLFVDVVFLTLTFLPTLAVAVLTAHLMVFAFMLQRYGLWQERAKITAAVVGAGLLAFIIAAPLWFPVVESLLGSDLVADYTSRRSYSFHVADNLLSFFTPMHYWESYTRGLMYFKVNDTIDHVSRALLPHIGLTVVFVLGLGRGALLQKGANKLLYALIFVFFCVLFNLFAFPQLFSYPPFNIFSIQYLGLPIVLAISYLLPQCWDMVAKGKTSIKGALSVLFLIALAFLSLFYRLGLPDEMPFKLYIYIFIVLWLLLFLVVLVVLVFWFKGLLNKDRDNKLGILVAAFTFILVVGELYFYMNHTRPERFEVINTPTELVQKIKGYVGDGRVFSAGINNTLFPEFGAMYGIRQSGTNNSTLVPWYQTVFVRNFGTSVPRYLDVGRVMLKPFGYKNKPKPSKKAFDLIGANVLVISPFTVGYPELAKEYGYQLLYKDDRTLVYKNATAMPRYYTVNNIVNAQVPIENSHTDLVVAVHSTDEALLLEAQQKRVSIVSEPNLVVKRQSLDSVDLLSESNAEIKLSAVMTQPGVLVALEAWHPNWRAWVDGKPAVVGLVNGAFRGVVLEAGDHEVVLRYRPRSLTIALWSSAVALLLVLLGLVVFRPRTVK